MKRTWNGLPILYQREQTIECEDEYGTHQKYTVHFTVRLVWYHGHLRWGIDTGDFCCYDKRLSDCVIRVLRVLAMDNPRYYRLEEFLDRKYLEERGERWRD